MTKAAVVNLEYEFDLLGSNLNIDQRLKYRKEFEHIYFFINNVNSQTPLYSKIDYKEDYLKFLQENLRIKTDIISNPSFVTYNWWGKLSNIELERKLNSKINSFKIAQELGIAPPEVSLVNSFREIEDALSRNSFNKYVLRKDISFSGKGNYFIRNDSDLLKLSYEKVLFKNGPLLFSPWFQRVLDLGVINYFGELSFHLNCVDQNGVYRGSYITSDIERLLSSLNSQFCPLVNQWVNKVKTIVNYIKDLDKTSDFGIDAFLYKEDEVLKVYSFCELNFRKTMGYLIRSLRKFTNGPNYLGKWIILQNSKKFNNFNSLISALGKEIYNLESKVGVLPTSPVENNFFTFMLTYPDLETINRKENWLRSVLK